MRTQNTTNEGTIKEFNNGNINVKFDLLADARRNCSDIEILNWLFDSVDCYLIGDQFCLSNYDCGVTVYNSYSDLCYVLSFSALDRAFKTGATMKLYAHKPETWEREEIDRFFTC